MTGDKEKGSSFKRFPFKAAAFFSCLLFGLPA